MRTLFPLLLVLALPLASAATAEAATTVATVDLVKVLNAHRRSEVIEAQFKDARKQAEADLQLARARADDLRKQLDGMVEGDPKRVLKEKQLQMQVNQMKWSYEWAVKVAVREYARSLEQLYAATRAVIANHARENGIDIVLVRTDPSRPMNALDGQDFALKSRLRTVVHADPKTDITDAILPLVK